jgi:hypothetical protein
MSVQFSAIVQQLWNHCKGLSNEQLLEMVESVVEVGLVRAVRVR